MSFKTREKNTDQKYLLNFPLWNCPRDVPSEGYGQQDLTTHILFLLLFKNKSMCLLVKQQCFCGCCSLKTSVKQSQKKGSIFYQNNRYCWKTHWHITVSPEKGQKRDRTPKRVSVFLPAISANPIKRYDLSPKRSLCLLDSHYRSLFLDGPECNSNHELPKYIRHFIFFYQELRSLALLIFSGFHQGCLEVIIGSNFL